MPASSPGSRHHNQARKLHPQSWFSLPASAPSCFFYVSLPACTIPVFSRYSLLSMAVSSSSSSPSASNHSVFSFSAVPALLPPKFSAFSTTIFFIFPEFFILGTVSMPTHFLSLYISYIFADFQYNLLFILMFCFQISPKNPAIISQFWMPWHQKKMFLFSPSIPKKPFVLFLGKARAAYHARADLRPQPAAAG